MGPYDILKVAADWSLAAVMAAVLIYVIKSSSRRESDLINRIIGVIEQNTKALTDIKPALEEITRFMDAVDRRLTAIESRLERMERGDREKDTF